MSPVLEKAAVIRPVLERAAADVKTMTYTEVAEACGGNRRSLGDALSAISNGSFREYGVMLSALVVLKGTNLPSGHFFDQANSLGFDVSDRKQFQSDELDRVFGKYSKKKH